MKKALLLLALPLLFVAACDSNNNTNSGTTPKTDPTPSTDPEPSTPVATTTYMTTINEGEIYFDFNLTTAIEGLKIKSETKDYVAGKQAFEKNAKFTFEGTPTVKYNLYEAIESGGVYQSAKKEGISTEGLKDMVERHLNAYSKLSGNYRIYFCITDTAQGWSKTIPGVDDIITKF